MKREWRLSRDSRLRWLQRTQVAGKMGGGRDAYLYGSDSAGLMRAEREVTVTWRSTWDSKLLMHVDLILLGMRPALPCNLCTNVTLSEKSKSSYTAVYQLEIISGSWMIARVYISIQHWDTIGLGSALALSMLPHHRTGICSGPVHAATVSVSLPFHQLIMSGRHSFPGLIHVLWFLQSLQLLFPSIL